MFFFIIAMLCNFQVLALCDHPALLEKPETSKLFR
jgi:hypothetical protein